MALGSGIRKNLSRIQGQKGTGSGSATLDLTMETFLHLIYYTIVSIQFRTILAFDNFFLIFVVQKGWNQNYFELRILNLSRSNNSEHLIFLNLTTVGMFSRRRTDCYLLGSHLLWRCPMDRSGQDWYRRIPGGKNRKSILQWKIWKKIPTSSRIHRSLTGGLSQLRHRVVVPARQGPWLAGRYDNPMLELTYSPSQESMNSATGKRCISHLNSWVAGRMVQAQRVEGHANHVADNYWN